MSSTKETGNSLLDSCLTAVLCFAMFCLFLDLIVLVFIGCKALLEK